MTTFRRVVGPPEQPRVGGRKQPRPRLEKDSWKGNPVTWGSSGHNGRTPSQRWKDRNALTQRQAPQIFSLLSFRGPTSEALPNQWIEYQCSAWNRQRFR